jgi:hypothetical protein
VKGIPPTVWPFRTIFDLLTICTWLNMMQGLVTEIYATLARFHDEPKYAPGEGRLAEVSFSVKS